MYSGPVSNVIKNTLSFKSKSMAKTLAREGYNLRPAEQWVPWLLKGKGEGDLSKNCRLISFLIA